MSEEKDVKVDPVSDLKSEDTKLADNAPSEIPETLHKEIEQNLELKENMKPETVNKDANFSTILEKDESIIKELSKEEKTPCKENTENDKG